MPQAITYDDIIQCALFREEERFPALCYYHKENGASIWISSQPKETALDKSDEKMIMSIIETIPKTTKPKIKWKDTKRTEARLHIFDVRIKDESSVKYDVNYPSTWVWNYEIESIQKTRESYLKLIDINIDNELY